MNVKSASWLLFCKNWVREHFFRYPTNLSLGYLWSFGSLAGICLVVQIISGLLLATHYLPAAETAFFTAEQLSREVNYGWLIRYTHSNGASFFFVVLYIHIFRSLVTASYSKNWINAWLVGMTMFILVIATAFFGYVLPWGQMSLWGATVITNLFSAVPVLGPKLVVWLWGGFSVDTPTLGKFFTLHFLLPFVIAALAVLHILFLHDSGSSSQLSTISLRDQKSFFSYYAVKDLLGLISLLFFLGCLVIYAPNLLGHPDNYIEANHMVTPLHIVPEWYFLPFYAILRSVPNKLNGVLLMFGSLLILFVFPYFNFAFGAIADKTSKKFVPGWLLTNINSAQLNVLHQTWVSFIVVIFILLGWLGGKPAIEPFTSVSLWLSTAYFVLFLFGRTISNIWYNLVWYKIEKAEKPKKIVNEDDEDEEPKEDLFDKVYFNKETLQFKFQKKVIDFDKTALK